MAAPDTSSILLGSGELFIAAWNPALGIPADAVFEHEDNSVGDIASGASLEYKPTVYVVKNDAGKVRKRKVTSEDVTFKTGVLTWNIENLGKLSPGTITTLGSVKTLALGGASSLVPYALRFVHTKDDGNKLRCTMVGTAGNGFTLTFDGAKETVLNHEFESMDVVDGWVASISEEIAAAGDVTAPVITVVPANAAVAVVVTAAVVFTSDDSLRSSDITAEHFMVFNDATNAIIAGALTRTTDKIVTFKSTANLAAATKFRYMAIGVHNMSGAVQAAPVIGFFTTA